MTSRSVTRDGQQQWRKLMRNGMERDYSWANPAREYIQLYEEIVRRRS